MSQNGLVNAELRTTLIIPTTRQLYVTLLMELKYESSNDLTNIYSINIQLLKTPNSESKDWDKYKLYLNKHDWFNIIDGSDHD